MALTKNEIIRKIKTKHWISRKKKKVSPSIALYIYQYLNFTSIRRWTEEDLYLFIILNYSFLYTFFHLTFQQTSSIILVQNLVKQMESCTATFLNPIGNWHKSSKNPSWSFILWDTLEIAAFQILCCVAPAKFPIRCPFYVQVFWKVNFERGFLDCRSFDRRIIATVWATVNWISA